MVEINIVDIAIRDVNDYRGVNVCINSMLFVCRLSSVDTFPELLLNCRD